MPVVASVDYPNRRIFLSADTVGVPLNVVDVYTELRERRRLDVTFSADRRFLPLIRAQGNEATGPSSATPRQVVLESGVRIVPFDTGVLQTLLVTPVPLINIAEGIQGSALFDRTTLTSIVDVDYQPQQVEIIRVNTGSAVTPQDVTDIAVAAKNEILGTESFP